MEADNYDELLSKINDPSFDILLCIQQLKANVNNIGVSHYLVRKLSTFPYFEVEFYIPQLIQILVSYESDSMALSELILEYSEKYPHFCLVVFWHLQAYVYELKNDPNSNSFLVVRSFINELQNVMFNFDSKSLRQKKSFRENLHPSIILTGMIAASFAVPLIQTYAKPIVVSQGKQQKSFLFKLANFHKSLTQNLTMKNRGKANLKSTVDVDDDEKSDSELSYNRTRSLEFSKSSSAHNIPVRHYSEDNSQESRPAPTPNQVAGKTIQRSKSLNSTFKNTLQTHSMPDLSNRDEEADEDVLTPALSNGSSSSLASLELPSRTTSIKAPKVPITHDQKVMFLHINYFKRVTEFMMSLHNISSRLSLVPKDARLTSLRAELTIINNTMLPSEIDIPQLLPISSNQTKKFHKILKLNITEACVLNSAERVPFLLLIEYLSEDLDFDPYTEQNKLILQYNNNESSGKFLKSADIDYTVSQELSDAKQSDVVEEADLADMSVIEISNEREFITNHLNVRQSNEVNRNWKNISKSGEVTPISDVNETSAAQSPDTGKFTDTKDLSTQVRIAAVMLQQLEKSGRANSEQSMAIKSRIIESMKALQDNFEELEYQQIAELDSKSDAGERKLENDFKLGEDWATKKNRIRKSSPYGHLKNWDLCSVIAKNGDDLPQEAFACQLIAMISGIWKNSNIGVWTKNMKILITSANAGLVETINNAMSIHSIKKSLTEISFKNGNNPKGRVVTLLDYFYKIYGDENSTRFKRAQDCFTQSLASYSIICYVLQIKDRHNGNIMLDNEGHIIHIDFGFLLSNSPGSVGFEAAPFKLTAEYIDLLGGVEGTAYLKFKSLCKAAFKELRKHHEQLVDIVDLMQKDSSLPCFNNGAQTSVLLKQRLQLDLNDDECDTFVDNVLIGKSAGSVYTRLYDQFQLLTQGIYS